VAAAGKGGGAVGGTTSGLLSNLSAGRRRELLADLSYLNLSEIKSFCRRHSIPYRILAETPDGGKRATADTDRKPVILRRIRHYLTTGEVPEATCLGSHIVRDGDPPTKLAPTDRLYYRWYSKTHRPVMTLLARLTGGRFQNGALARVLIMEFWTRGEAPTLEQFAAAWITAKDNQRDVLTPDYAYLTDRQRGEAGADWKAVRQETAERVMATLAKIPRS
jgi:hypothetical protein